MYIYTPIIFQNLILLTYISIYSQIMYSSFFLLFHYHHYLIHHLHPSHLMLINHPQTQIHLHSLNLIHYPLYHLPPQLSKIHLTHSSIIIILLSNFYIIIIITIIHLKILTIIFYLLMYLIKSCHSFFMILGKYYFFSFFQLIFSSF